MEVVGRADGGPGRDRTDDLIHAMDALSQLSYSPVRMTLFLNGNLPPLASREVQSRRTEGREDTRNLQLEKR